MSRAPNSADVFERLLDAIGTGVPDARQYETMSNLMLEFPASRELVRLNPFSAEYREAAFALYLSLRGRTEQDYVVRRDEASPGDLPAHLWTDLIPWSFRDARMVSEHVFAWGQVLRHANLPAGGSVLEYGPGSGQMLLMLARMGYRACGVDIDAIALAGITAQATHLDLAVETERAEFGSGFDGQRFDCILFYEAFHHAFDFETLLIQLHDKLKPDGRVLLCGEPVARAPHPGIPYPWGPRLDALSVFCIRRFGWMELGFTHDFLVQLARATGWTATLHRFPQCPRAAVYILQPARTNTVVPAAVAWQRGAPLRLAKHQLVNMLRTSRTWLRRR